MTIQELEQVVAQEGTNIYSFCLQLTGSKLLADELYQDTFLKATEKIKKLDGDGNLRSYFLSIALMLWKNQKRKFAWRNRIAPVETFREEMEETIGGEGDILQDCLREEQCRLVREAVAALPEKYRVPILLYYMEEMQVAEVAKVLGIPPGTVKSRLSVARKRLESELEGYYHVREAIVDKNQVRVQVAVKAVDPEKYLLVPEGIGTDMYVENLRKGGLKGNRTIADYAESLGKKCLTVGADIRTKMQSAVHHTEEDGTMLFNIEYKNDHKGKKMDYVCETYVYPSEGNDEDRIQDEIRFTLTDQTDVEQIKYIPVKKGKVPGTDLVVDEVIFDKSDLEMICNVKYHYAGKMKDWSATKEFDMCFYLLDSQGKVVESMGKMDGSMDEGTKVTQSWQYSLTKLPKTISFQAKDVMEKKTYGTVEMELVK